MGTAIIPGINSIRYQLLNFKSFFMKLFDFFRRAEKEVAQVAQPIEPKVDQNLFVADEEPMFVEVPKKQSALSLFLNIDYMQRGSYDGYLYPNADLLEANIKKLRSDFRNAIDEAIDEKRSTLNELKLHQVGTKGISERLEEEMNHRIHEIENLIHELDVQKVFSVENEGLVASSLNDYRIGFVKGVERYRQEKLIGGSTNLF